MKYTVVVAEDEELLLNNLVQKIQKADPDFQVIRHCPDRRSRPSALVEQLSSGCGHLRISSMPVMDGMALLTRSP